MANAPKPWQVGNVTEIIHLCTECLSEVSVGAVPIGTNQFLFGTACMAHRGLESSAIPDLEDFAAHVKPIIRNADKDREECATGKPPLVGP